MALRRRPATDNHPARNAGITLIELLIVMFVIGILLAIAIPTYISFSSRAKVSDALSTSRLVIVEATYYWDVQGVLPTSIQDLGFSDPTDFASTHVQSVDVTPAGVIEVQFVPSALQGAKLLFTSTDNGGSLDWTCSAPGIDPFLLPGSCRP